MTQTEKQPERQNLAEFTRYIWWKTTGEALEFPDRLIAKMMLLADFEDLCRLIDLAGKARLLHVLQHAEAGEFDARSWAYWHYRLTDIPYGAIPPMPKRTFRQKGTEDEVFSTAPGNFT